MKKIYLLIFFSFALYLSTKAQVTSTPSIDTVCENNSTFFSVVAPYSNASYQWQVLISSTWTNIIGTEYSGINDDTLLISNIGISFNNNNYRCLIDTLGIPTDTSSISVLVVNSTPQLLSNPTDSIVCEGNEAVFRISATGTSLTYQWQVNTGSGFVDITASGSNPSYANWNSDTLTVNATIASNNGNLYRCIVSGTCPSPVTSNAATLTVNTAPSIASHPSDSTICAGSNTIFGVSASGTALTYQWQVNTGSGFLDITASGSNPSYANWNSDTLRVNATIASNNGILYRCIVSGTCPSPVTSNAATLVVNTAPSIASHPSDSTICAGSNTIFGVSASGTALTYQWQVNTGSGFTDITSSGSSPIYSNWTSDTLRVNSTIASNDGFQYRCVVSGTCPSPVTSNAATLTVNTVPSIAWHPSDSTICAGSNTIFGVSATGTSLTYQWQVNTGSGFTDITSSGSSPIYSNWTSDTLRVNSTIASNDGFQYRCVVSGTCPSPVTSNTATLTVNTAPSIVSHPSATTLCAGGNTSFGVSATGTSLTYQWQVNTGSGFTDITSSGSSPIYSNWTSDTLLVNSTITSNNGSQYRCIVSGACPSPMTSNAATLTINSAPAINNQPANSTICPGANTYFNITATGTNLVYQWQVNTGSGFTNITAKGSNPSYSNWTSDTLRLTSTIPGNNGYLYRCVISGTCPSSVTSNTATLGVNNTPSIVSHPSSTTICAGNSASFGVSATGSSLSYQWQVNTGSGFAHITASGSNPTYANWTNDTLRVNSTIAANNGFEYRCIVSFTCASPLTSNTAALTVNTAPSIISHPSASTICAGSNTTFGVSATGSSLTYQWQVNTGSGFANITSSGSNPTYSNWTNDTLRVNFTIASNNGNQYRCIVSGTCPSPLTSNAATLTVNTAPSIASHPSASTICAGSSTSFGVSAIGTSLSYQWQVNTGSGFANITTSGSNPSYTNWTSDTLRVNSTIASNNGNQYRCIVSGTCPSPLTSNAATLTVNTAPSIASHPSASTICAGSNTTFGVSASGTSLTYQWQVNTGSGFTDITTSGSNPSYVNWNSDTLRVNATIASNNGNQYRCIVSGTCPSPLTSNAATLTVNTAPSIASHPSASTICAGSNTTFGVSAAGTSLTYQWQVNTGSGFANITSSGNNPSYTNWISDTLKLSSTVSSNNGYQYRCVVSGSCPSPVTSNAAALAVNTAPSIVSHPSASTICAGSNTTFGVSAAGTSLTYQWQVNTGSGFANITSSGSNPSYTNWTSDTLKLSSIVSSNNGFQYRCIISGTCPSPVTSNAASLSVNTAPSIVSHPSTATICAGSNTSFGVSATGSSLTYQWQVNTGSGFANITATGSNPSYTNWTSDTLKLSSTVSSNNGFQYRCIVSGSCPSPVTSNAAALAVNTAPSIVAHPSASTICAGSNTSFGVSAAGTSLTYQWQVNTGSGFANITSSGSNPTYSNWTSDTLRVNSTIASNNGNQYRCILSGTCPSPVTSNAATLTVNTAPSIISHPSASTICAGSNTSFGVSAIGTSLTYQWQVNTGSGFANITSSGSNPTYSNWTSDTLRVNSTIASNNGNLYRCIVSGTCPSPLTSNAATLTVNTAPSIASHPSASTICAGSNTIFGVSATGTSLTYQWQVNTGSGFANITTSGSNPSYTNWTSDTLRVNATIASNNGNLYRCIVSGTCPTPVTSNASTLNVNTAPSIISHPSASTICAGSSTSFGVSATGTSLTYQWQVNTGGGFVNITTSGSNPSYTNWTSDTLKLSSTVSSNNGFQYRCIVSGTCPSPLTSNAATLTINSAPSIISHPSASTLCAGNNTSFGVSATGTSLTYQWQVNTGSGFANITTSGSNPSYTNWTSDTLRVNATIASNNGNLYRCIVSGTCPSPVTSNAATLTINTAPSIINQPTSSNICPGGNTLFRVIASGTSLTYQWQVNSGTGYSNITTSGSNPSYANWTSDSLRVNSTIPGNSGLLYRCIISGTCPSPVTSNAATLTIGTAPVITSQPNNTTLCEGSSTSYNITATGTSLSYQWQVNASGSWADITSSGSNPTYSNWNTSALGVNNVASWNQGYQYRCVVSGLCSPSATTNSANLLVNTIPSFASHPANSTVCEGSSTQYQCVANGTNLNYQWQVNTGSGFTNITSSGSNPSYSNWNTSTLSLSGIGASNNNYLYRCIISNTGCNNATSNNASLFVNPKPLVNAGSNVSICAGSSANLTTTVTSGTPPFSYSWTPTTGLSNPNIANPIASPTTITTYVVKVTDFNGCINSDDIVVNVNSLPTANAGSDIAICKGTSTQLSASGGISYQWSPTTGLSNPNIFNPLASPVNTTIYTVTVTDNNGCKNTDDIKVTVNSLPNANAGSDISICKGSSTTLNASGGILYHWSPSTGLNNPNISNPTASPSSTTTYIVTVENSNGCISTDSVVVTVNTLPIANAGSDVSICSGSSTQLNASGGVSYLWTPSTGLSNPYIANPIASPVAVTTYTVKVTDANGCSSTDDVQVKVNALPLAKAGFDATICLGGSTQLNASGGISYHWSPSTGLSNANIANPLASPITTTFYSVTVTDSNGCTASDEIKISVNPLPIANAGIDTAICKGNNIQLNATGGITYNWSPSVGLSNTNIPNPIASPAVSTNYIVTVGNINGCISKDTIRITVNPLPNAFAGNDVSICQGSSVALNASGGISYRWVPSIGLSNANISNPIASPATTTDYIVFVTNNQGCVSSDTVTIKVNPNPKPNAGLDAIICEGSNILLNASIAKTYNWSPIAGLSNSTIRNPIASPVSTTNYILTVTDSNGCSGIDTVKVIVLQNPQPKISGENSVCKNSSWKEYCIHNTSNNINWNITNGTILTGQGTNCVKVHWSDTGTSGIIKVSEHQWTSPYCIGFDSIKVNFNKGNAPVAATVIAKAGDLSTNILLCQFCNYNIYEWGYENISNPIEITTCKANTWCLYDKLDINNNYYWVKVGNDTGCLTKSYFNAPTGKTGIQNEQEKNNLLVYPNPTTGIFTLQSATEIEVIEIYNLLGTKIVCAIEWYPDSNSASINLSNKASGVYLLAIKTKQGIINKMIVKE